jgi:hypothetical protein
MPRERRLTEKAAVALADKQVKDVKKANAAESRRVSKAAEGQMDALTNAFGNVGFGATDAPPVDDAMGVDGGRRRRRKTGKKLGRRKRKTKKNFFGY